MTRAQHGRAACRLISCAVLTVSIGLGTWSGLTAYVSNGHTWGTTQVLYYVNPVNLHVPEAAAVTAVQRGADAWSQQSGANVQLVYAGYTSGSSLALNRKNEVFFRNDVAYPIAETYWWWDASGQLVDADIVYHQNYKFFTHDAGACSGGYYIENTGTHEFGHVLGLGHSTAAVATMWATSGTCETTRETLDADDIAGIEVLYPPAGTPDPPAAPTQLTAANNAAAPTSSLLISWTDNASNESGYRVERSAAGGSFVQVAQFAANAQGFTDSALSAGTTYAYRVAAFNSDGSAYSNVASAQTEDARSQGPPLTVRLYKIKGQQKADLAWSGLVGSAVDLLRNGARIVTTANDGAETDPINRVGGGSYTYRVCVSGTSVCSIDVSATF